MPDVTPSVNITGKTPNWSSDTGYKSSFNVAGSTPYATLAPSGSTPYNKVSGSNVQSAALSGIFGGLAGGVPGALLSLGTNLLQQYFQNRQARKNQDSQNAFNAEQAALANARASDLMDKEKRLNSVQRQVSDLRMAGLNPALATGQISAGTVSGTSSPAASGSAAPAAPYTPVDLAANMMTAAQVENLESSSALNRANTSNVDLNNKYIDSLRQSDIAKQFAEIAKLKTSAALDDSQKKQIDDLLDLLKRQYESTITLNNANASAVPQSIEESKARQGLAEAQAATEPFKRSNLSADTNLKKEQAATEPTRRENISADTGLKSAQTLTESEQQQVLRTVAALNTVNKDKLALDLGLSTKQRDMIHDYCVKHGLDEGYEKAIYLALDEFSQSAGHGVPQTALQVLGSWLDGGNWLHFIASSRLNEVIAQNAESNKKTADAAPSAPPVKESNDPVDVVRTVPSDANLAKHVESMSKKINNKDFIKDWNDFSRLTNNLLSKKRISKDQYNDLKKDLYYIDDPHEFLTKFYEYYESFKLLND